MTGNDADITADPSKMSSGSLLLKSSSHRGLSTTGRKAMKKHALAKEDLRLNALMPLLEVSSALVSEVKLEKLFNLIVEVVSRETRANRVSLMLLDKAAQRLTIGAAVGLPEKIAKSAAERVGHGIAGSVVKTGKPVLLDGVAKYKGRMGRSEISSALCVPLIVRGRVIGVINSSKMSGQDPFTQSDLELLSILASQAAIAIENAMLFQNVEAQQARLEQLLKQLLKAQEEERERISAEIHDSVAQWMVTASYHAQSSSALLLESRLDEARDEIEYATRIIGQSVKEIRRIITDLYPPALTELGLVEALRQNVDYFRKETGIVCCFQGGLTEELSPVQKIAIYRIVQEALNNVRKHAHATEVEVRLRSCADEVSAEIQDNGRGFDPDSAVGGGGVSSGKMGLLTMKGRAEMLGGDLRIETGRGSGTKVVLTIPLPSHKFSMA